MTTESYGEDLELAHRLVDAAAEIALRSFRAPVTIHRKPDGSPVTVVDLECDSAIVSILGDKRPRDAILSEESGQTGSSPRRWIIDPLDGTNAFIAGHSGWGTYVALEEWGQVVLGVINHPAEERRYWARLGHGARAAAVREGRIVRPSRAVQLAGPIALTDARFASWPPLESDARQALDSVATWVEPTFDFLVDLLESRVDVLLSHGGGPWDYAAALVIVEEAGGTFCDPDGGRRLDLAGGIFMRAELERELLTLLRLPRRSASGGHEMTSPGKTSNAIPRPGQAGAWNRHHRQA